MREAAPLGQGTAAGRAAGRGRGSAASSGAAQRSPAQPSGPGAGLAPQPPLLAAGSELPAAPTALLRMLFGLLPGDTAHVRRLRLLFVAMTTVLASPARPLARCTCRAESSQKPTPVLCLLPRGEAQLWPLEG